VVVGVATPTLAPSSAIASSNTVSLSVDVERLPVKRNIKTTNAPLASGTSDAANKKTSLKYASRSTRTSTHSVPSNAAAKNTLLEYARHSTTTPTSSAQAPMSSIQEMEDGDEFQAAFNIDDIDEIEAVTVIAKHQPPEKRKAVDLEPGPHQSQSHKSRIVDMDAGPIAVYASLATVRIFSISELRARRTYKYDGGVWSSTVHHR
jgi:hypothetical protein